MYVLEARIRSCNWLKSRFIVLLNLVKLAWDTTFTENLNVFAYRRPNKTSLNEFGRCFNTSVTEIMDLLENLFTQG